MSTLDRHTLYMGLAFVAIFALISALLIGCRSSTPSRGVSPVCYRPTGYYSVCCTEMYITNCGAVLSNCDGVDSYICVSAIKELR